ncbi:MAG: Ig-like domain-containing protein [Rhodovibrio sp.]|nr:Ig-like domain-containing protein [Rhodovibrio sp.]
MIANLDGDTPSFTEGDAETALDVGGNATVNDPDSADFDGGTLTVSITAGGTGAEDVLTIQNQGTGAGEIGFNSGTGVVTFGGTQIGTATGGTGGTDLVITLDADAQPQAGNDSVSALISALVYQNTAGDDPTGGDRTIQVTLTDAGTNAASTSETLTLSVTPLNDAPVLTPASPTLATISEDASNPAGTDVATLFGGNITDPDSGAQEGVAVTGTTTGTAGGTWQFSTDGGTTWQAVGAVSNGSALLLAASDQVRFVPDGDNGTTATLTVRAWDQTSGTAGSKVDASSTGGSTAFSSASDTASITVTGLNDAPSLSGTATLAAVAEDTANPAGATVATLVGGLFVDGDAGASLTGVAITGNAATAGEGTWQVRYGGSDWIDLPTVSSGAALVLDTTSELRFVPAADYNGTPGALSLRAVDDTYAGAFSTATGATLTAVTQDVTGAGSGGTTAFGGADTALTTSITAVNDAPAITAPATASVDEDGTVGIAGLSIADVDAGGGNLTVTLGVSNGVLALGGTAGLTVSGDGTGSVTATGTLADLNAALAGLAYTPAADFNGADSLSIGVDDQGNSGGAAATDNSAVAITVNAVNDAPSLTGPASLAAVNEDAGDPAGAGVATLVGGLFADVDSGASLAGVAITGNAATAAEGTWQVQIGGTGWIDLPAVSDTSALVLSERQPAALPPRGRLQRHAGRALAARGRRQLRRRLLHRGRRHPDRRHAGRNRRGQRRHDPHLRQRHGADDQRGGRQRRPRDHSPGHGQRGPRMSTLRRPHRARRSPTSTPAAAT